MDAERQQLSRETSSSSSSSSRDTLSASSESPDSAFILGQILICHPSQLPQISVALQEVSGSAKNGKAEEIIECPICLEENPQGHIQLESCCHIYCSECIRMHITTKMDDFQVDSIQCPDTKCQQAITEEQLKDILGPTLFERLEYLNSKKAESTSSGIIWCANPKGCQASLTISELNPAGSDTFTCSECSYEFCPRCRLESHHLISCVQNSLNIKNKIKKRRGIFRSKKIEYTQEELDLLTSQYLNRHVKNCPNCGVETMRDSGCPNIKCSRCNTSWQWEDDPRKSFLDYAEKYPLLMRELFGSREYRGKMERKEH
eukprot:TRINITY_DN4099_c0_g1_i1.p1 TRINITY_DN4099_c0_g1~~TRINITY_DN4099_c0_g1_i1.p1  ORF type:complete len:324 (-),score=67.95 TRINITY_DN4099_c0_g1_i1:58-1008(-)